MDLCGALLAGTGGSVDFLELAVLQMVVLQVERQLTYFLVQSVDLRKAEQRFHAIGEPTSWRSTSFSLAPGSSCGPPTSRAERFTMELRANC